MGLGEPFEGPAALEALANGCFFINPKVFQESSFLGLVPICMTATHPASRCIHLLRVVNETIFAWSEVYKKCKTWLMQKVTEICYVYFFSLFFFFFFFFWRYSEIIDCLQSVFLSFGRATRRDYYEKRSGRERV